MYLIDTNIFLEVLLTQEKKETCKKFLDVNIKNLYISDFSLHSIGVILFKNNKEHIFHKFIADVISKVEIITLSKGIYRNLVNVKKDLQLDFDDAYQFTICKEHGLQIVTMDEDFEKVKDKIRVLFLQ